MYIKSTHLKLNIMVTDSNDPRSKSRHHIVPRSKGGRTVRKNIASITRERHQKYHSLFSNRTPDEILEYLSHYFWKNNNGVNGDRFIRQYLKKVEKSFNTS